MRLKLTSYQSPVVVGDPPVISAARPGNESEIYGVDALVYVMPWPLSCASVEPGCAAM